LKVEILVSSSNLELNAGGRVAVDEQLPIHENTVNQIGGDMVQDDHLHGPPKVSFQALFQG
jgi:hypothetical protein